MVGAQASDCIHLMLCASDPADADVIHDSSKESKGMR